MRRSLYYSHHNIRFRSNSQHKNQIVICKNRNYDNNKTSLLYPHQSKGRVVYFSTSSATTSGTANITESTTSSTIRNNEEDIKMQRHTEDNSTSYDSASNWRRLAMMTTIDQQRINQMNDISSNAIDMNTTNSIMSSRTTSSIPINRTKKDILYLVKQRVIERNSWTIHGVSQKEIGGFPAFARLLKELIPKFLNFTIPCTKELDTKFPVLSMNWNIIQNYNNNNNFNNINTPNNKQQLHDGNTNSNAIINTTTTSATMINNKDSSNNDNQMQVTWLGHSSLLVQMDQYNILADPIFSLRCSPFQWIGPKRYRPPPCTISQLMNNVRRREDKEEQKQSSNQNNNNDNRIIDVILISHNHYDHLDYLSIKEIVDHCTNNNISYPIFFVPLGLKVWFHNYISTEIIIYEMDWYETVNIIPPSTSSNNSDNAMLQVTCLPMRHWSNRGHDRDETLWCGYKVVTTSSSSVGENNTSSTLDQQKNEKIEHNNNIIREKKKRFLFSGDTAWFDEMKHIIGIQYGPYDVSAIPIGAYEPWNIMKSNHLNPYEAILMKSCINTKYAIPIHYGTFPLTTEPVYEPYELLQCYMKQKDDKSNTFIPWLIGETKQFPCM